MTHTKIRAKIDYEAQNSPSDHESRQRTHTETETFDNKKEALEWVQSRIGVENLKESGKGTYIDRETENGTETVQTGKCYSYWTEYRDRSRGIYNVWETAWVEFTEHTIEELDIDELVNEVEN